MLVCTLGLWPPKGVKATADQDSGGTNTDCVVLHPGEADEPHRGIRSALKTATTANVTDGIITAIKGAIAQSGINRSSVAAVMIGTTVWCPRHHCGFGNH